MNGQSSSRNNPLNAFAGWLRQHPGSALVYFVLLPIMACAVLALPPIALPARLVNVGYKSFNKAGVTITNSDGAEVTIPENAIKNGSSVRLNTVPLDTFLKSDLAHSLPSFLDPRSSLYRVEVQGEQPNQTNLIVPLPSDVDSNEAVDLYAYYAQRWFKIPFILNTQDGQLESSLNFTPEAFIVVQALTFAPSISAEIGTNNGLPDSADNVLLEVNPDGLQIADQGALAGDPISTQETGASSNFQLMPTVTNVDANGARTDITGNMMSNDTARTAHINALVDLAVERVYRGYNISYEGISTSDEPLYTAFIKELAHALHAKEKTLSVTLPAPTPVSADEFDTAGYNWALIGRYADEVKIPLLSDPQAYEGDPSLQDQYLQWAVDQIDRSKIQLIAPTAGRDSPAQTYTPIAFGDALKLVGSVSVPPDAQPGSDVTLQLDGLAKAGGIQLHEPSGLFYFNYKDQNNAAHTVWLENADSLAKKVGLALKYHIGGISLADYDPKGGADERIWTVLENFKSLQPTVVDDQLKLIWTVDGKQIGSSTVSDPKIVWKAPQDGGQHNIQVALSVDGTTTAGAPLGGVVKLALQPTATPTPQATEVPTEAPTSKAPVSTGPKPTAKPATTTSKPPPATGGSFAGKNLFGYGIQLNWTGNDRDAELSQVNSLGFGWVKIQVRWCDVEGARGRADLNSIDDLVGKAHAHGVQVLFSVVCAPAWSRSDGGSGGSGPPDNMQDAADFMGGLAGKYCNQGLGAIEVWNEENLLTEWHGHPLSAAAYIDMISKAYPAIKAACPGVVVVSGALTPTGYNDGVTAFDDVSFLGQLYQAGLKNYSDAIGAHPSGFNVPAMCNILDPACTAPPGTSYMSPWEGGGAHNHSWGFLGTMLSYRQVMSANGDGNKQIWPTEFGWPVGNGGGCPGGCHPDGVDNTQDKVASYFVQAFQWAKQQGWVGVMFVWNLDFNSGEVGLYHIQGEPAFGALAGMPK